MHSHQGFNLLISELSSATIIEATYDPSLVALSIFTAVLSSYMAFVLSSRLDNVLNSKEQVVIVGLAALFLGAGIWSMHFIGMMAYQLPITVEYDPLITFLSVFPSIFASYIVLSPRWLKANNLIISSTLMGAGIGTMHYVGMLAMRFDAMMAYDLFTFILSIFVAVFLSGLALKLNSIRIQKFKHSTAITFSVSLIMGLAISSMHYVGMMSMIVYETPNTVYGSGAENDELIRVIWLVLLILAGLFFSTIKVRLRLSTAERLNEVLATISDSVITVNDKGFIVFTNQSAIDLFSNEDDQLVGKHVLTLLESDSKEKIDFISDANKRKKALSLEMQDMRCNAVNSNGNYFPISLSVNPIKGSSFGNFLITVKDMSDLHNQEAFMQAVFDNVPQMILIKNSDTLESCLINKAYTDTLGNEIEPSAKSKADDQLVLTERQPITITEQLITKQKESIFVQTKKVPIIDMHGTVQYILSVSEDVTEIKQAELALSQQNHRMSMAADAAHIGIWEWDLESNELSWDDWMFKIFGTDKHKFNNSFSDWVCCVHPEDYAHTLDQIEEAVVNRGNFDSQYRIIQPGGKIRYIKALAVVSGHKMVGINFDVTDKVESEQKIIELAQTDNLTGLANRSVLSTFLKREAARCERSGSWLVCLYFDLDDFKPINDTYGHKAGDVVLVEIAKRLRLHTRETDCVARIGGDEFVVILSEIENEEQVFSTRDRFIESFLEPIESEQGLLQVGVSFGYSIYPKEVDSVDALQSKADERMYKQKTGKKSKKHCL